MDLPWNPAILEQRIARIHRMGQKRPVQIVNFVAKGTIEEGMLSVLAFKRSQSAGILDGDVGEISLGGSRLNRFMKDVENVTGGMGEGEAMAPAEEAASVAAAPAEVSTDATVAGEPLSAVAKAPEAGIAPQEASPDPWAALLQIGTQLVSVLTATDNASAAPHPWVERDPATGACSLKVPLPSPETARRLADALSAIADSPRGKGAGK